MLNRILCFSKKGWKEKWRIQKHRKSSMKEGGVLGLAGLRLGFARLRPSWDGRRLRDYLLASGPMADHKSQTKRAWKRSRILRQLLVQPKERQNRSNRDSIFCPSNSNGIYHFRSNYLIKFSQNPIFPTALFLILSVSNPNTGASNLLIGPSHFRVKTSC